jgi:hypothetical protein
MSPFAVEVHPLGADEDAVADQRYRDRNGMGATRFRQKLDRVVEIVPRVTRGGERD